LDAGQPVVLDDQPGHRAVDDAHGAGGKPLALVAGQRAGTGEEDDVVRPLADQLRVRDGVGAAANECATERGERRAAPAGISLRPMAVRRVGHHEPRAERRGRSRGRS
jgi:hypothetical protein